MIERRFAAIVIGSVCFLAQSTAMAQEAEAPAELRSLLEGTWELVEWHVDGEVLRPPQAGGRWSNHDGVVVATFHRDSAAGFESFVGYGTYEIDASSWSYTYERVQTASGPSSGEAAVAVRSGESRGGSGSSATATLLFSRERTIDASTRTATSPTCERPAAAPSTARWTSSATRRRSGCEISLPYAYAVYSIRSAPRFLAGG